MTVEDFTKTGDEDEPIAFELADFQARFTDSSGAPLATVRVESIPAHGALALAGSPVVASQEIAASDLATLSYTPASDWHGSDSFQYNATGGAAWNFFVRVLGVNFWAWMMLVGIIGAVLGMVWQHKPWSVLLLLPQQFVMFGAFVGGICTLCGVFDPFPMSRVLRSAVPGMLAFFCHTGAMFDHYAKGRAAWAVNSI